MQRLARERDRLPSAIGGIADQRMADRGEMHANLVRTSRLEPAAQQRGRTEALDDLVVGARRPCRSPPRPSRCAASGGARSARRRRRRAPDRRPRPPAYSRVTLRACNWRTSAVCAASVLRDDQEAAGVLVEAMDDAGARQPRRAPVRDAAARSAACPASCRARMHHEPGRLVDDQERVVLVHHGKLDGLGHVSCLGRIGLCADDHALAAANLGADVHDGSVHGHETRGDPAPAAGSANTAEGSWPAPDRNGCPPARGEDELVNFRDAARRHVAGGVVRDSGCDGAHCRHAARRPGSRAASAIIVPFPGGTLRMSASMQCSRSPRAGAWASWSAWMIAALLAAALAGCSWLPEVKDETADWTAEKLYREAHDNADVGQLYAGDQALRDARGALPVRPPRAAGDPGIGVRQLARRRARCGHRRVRPLHPHLPQSPQRRLRVLPQGSRQFPRGPGTARLRLRDRPVRARAQGDARVVRCVQGARHQVSREQVRTRTPTCGCAI